MKCPNCSTEVNDKKLFCTMCKAPLHLDEEIFVPDAEETQAVGEEQGSASRGFRGRGSGSRNSCGEARAKAGFMFRGRLRKSWLIRILVTILILAILIAALLLIAHSRRAEGEARFSVGMVDDNGARVSLKEGSM